MTDSKSQAIENKAVAKPQYRVGMAKKKAWQNEGITRHIYENK
ncbi:MAG: hypothetical protein WAO35_07955 [Terriglobia bacterium]